jgi:hypothetical protein
VLAARARRRVGLDPDKLPDSALRELVVDGVTIESRYRRADEFDQMQKMVSDLPPDVRGKIATVFCDSQFGDSYKVELRSTATRADAVVIGEALDLALVTGESRGHNGINVEGRFGFFVLDPVWLDG